MSNVTTLSIKNNDYAVSIELPNENFNSVNIEKLVKNMADCFNLITGTEIKQLKMSGTAQDNLETTPYIPTPHDEFKIRERLPNNIIDVKDLDIKQAITEKALVRCPKCGQAHCLALNSSNSIFLLKRNYEKNDFDAIAEFDSITSDDFNQVCCKPDTDRLAYFNDLQNAPAISNDDFTVENDTEVFCPVCCKSDSFLNWKKAYDTPLEFFETEHICDVCGGETVTKMIKKQKVNKCEKCGYETNYKE